MSLVFVLLGLSLVMAAAWAWQRAARNIGWVDGTVAWTQDNRFGIAFVEEIDPKLARAPVAGGTPDLASPRFTRTPLEARDKLRNI